MIFQSTPPSREATPASKPVRRSSRFQSTPPSREATTNASNSATQASISIHAPLTGGDVNRVGREYGLDIFQSTPPSREATIVDCPTTFILPISIHAPLTGGDAVYIYELGDHQISIHAPLTGGDGTLQNLINREWISIHAPLTGGDGGHQRKASTASYFNPRPPHGRRR